MRVHDYGDRYSPPDRRGCREDHYRGNNYHRGQDLEDEGQFFLICRPLHLGPDEGVGVTSAFSFKLIDSRLVGQNSRPLRRNERPATSNARQILCHRCPAKRQIRRRRLFDQVNNQTILAEKTSLLPSPVLSLRISMIPGVYSTSYAIHQRCYFL